jgi:RHS repeat-associated protein
MRTTTWAYDVADNVLSTTDPVGAITSYAYDTLNRTTTVVEGYSTSLVRSTRTIYDLAGNVVATINARGVITCFLYDAMNRQTTEIQANTLPEQVITTTLYDLAGNVLSSTDGRHVTTSYLYDALNRRVQQIDAWAFPVSMPPLNHQAPITTTVYDAAGNVLSVADPLNHITSYVYDADNRQTQQIDGWSSPFTALTRTTTTVYDAVGNVLAVTDARNVTTSYGYDPVNRRNLTVQPLTEIIPQVQRYTTVIYDQAGNVLSQTVGYSPIPPPYSHPETTSFAYDTLNRQTTMIEAWSTSLARNTLTAYNKDGTVFQVTDPGQVITTYAYDVLKRRTQEYDATGVIPPGLPPLNHNPPVTTYVYDAADNLIQTQDPLGHITTNAYDGLNRLVSTQDARGGVVSYVLDANGNRLSVTDPLPPASQGPDITTWVYDALNREAKETDPFNKNTTFVYNAGSLLISKTNRNQQRFDFTYDILNRLSTETWCNSSGTAVNWLTYTYDPNNNMLSAADIHGAVTMAYDSLNRQKSRQDMFGMLLTSTYDAADNRSAVSDSLGGVTIATFDTLNRMATLQFSGVGLTPARIDLTYTTRDQIATEKRYSDITGLTLVGTSSMAYDALKRMAYLQHNNGSGGLLDIYTYTYDIASRLTQENAWQDGIKTYTYDNTNELTNDGTNTYTYDLNGNRNMANYTVGPGNQYSATPNWTYLFDKEGNTTDKIKTDGTQRWFYSYDNLNHLVSVALQQSGVTAMLVTYVYDVLGNRIERDYTQNGGPVTISHFAYDGQEVWADLDGNNGNALLTRYLHGQQVDQLFARIAGAAGPVTWYLTDRLGSTRDLMNSSGSVIDHLAYDGYGVILTETQPTNGDRYKWTGRELDALTTLQYNRGRNYDPTIGRWISQDPIGFDAGDANLYRYVHNTPTNAIDPSGLKVKTYVHYTTRLGGLISAKGGHVTIFWIDNRQYAEFEGGGGSLSGTGGDDKAYVRGSDLKRLFRSDFAALGDNPTDDAIEKALSRVKITGWPQDRNQDDPKKGYYWDVVTSNHQSAEEELCALFREFLKLKQLA